MEQNVCSTTEVPARVQVLTKFVTQETDEDRDDGGEASDCGVRCCFNQQQGCPLDQDDNRCLNGGGYFVVSEVIKYG